MTAILHELRTHSVYCIGIWHIVKMNYLIESESKQWFPMCKRCFTNHAIDFDDEICINRRHSICDGFADLCNFVMDTRNWCIWCKNTPILEMLRESVCVAKYGELLHDCPCSYGCLECTNDYKDYWCIRQRCPEDIYQFNCNFFFRMNNEGPTFPVMDDVHTIQCRLQSSNKPKRRFCNTFTRRWNRSISGNGSPIG